MKEKAADEELVAEVRKALDRRTDGLEEETLHRLREIRLSALDMAENNRAPIFSLRRWITAGGFAMVAVMVLAISIWFVPQRRNLPIRQPDEVEIITAQEQLELYEELEFYRWLSVESADRKGLPR